MLYTWFNSTCVCRIYISIKWSQLRQDKMVYKIRLYSFQTGDLGSSEFWPRCAHGKRTTCVLWVQVLGVLGVSRLCWLSEANAEHRESDSAAHEVQKGQDAGVGW